MIRNDPESRQVRRVAARAIWRLNMFELAILAAAAALALGAGALVALLLDAALELPFRMTWAVASLLLFILPATIAYLRDRRSSDGAGAPARDPRTNEEERDSHGR